MINHKTDANRQWYNLPKWLWLAIFPFILHSCVKDKLREPEPDSDPVEFSLTLDWSSGEGVEVPATFAVCIGQRQAVLSGNPVTFPHELETGNYRMLVYTIHEDITVNENIATVSGTSNSRSDVPISSQPGWLFSAAQDVELNEGENTTTAVMRQLVRVLTLSIDVEEQAGEIQSATAELQGVVHSVNLDTGEILEGGASSSAPFVLNGTELVATFQLLGLQPEEDHNLMVTVTYTDDSEQVFTNDLTEQLAGFNTGETTEPLKLETGMQIIQTEAGFTATINDWQMISGTGSAQ